MTFFVSFARQNKNMHLIADGGSTKTEWVLLDGQRVVMRFVTQGFNPNYTDGVLIASIIAKEFPSDFPEEVEEISYYGSGCGSERNCRIIKEILLERFPKSKVLVTHDMMAAAHAVLGREKGIACILGTGANSCLYDGEKIVEQAVSLGYLVGDEGSGTYIGKSVVRSYFYGLMPSDLSALFEKEYHLSHKDFIDKVYHCPQPNSYLASFSKFAGKYQSHPFVRQLCADCFCQFLDVFVCRYADFKRMRISFVGSVAYHFQSILKTCLEERGLQIGTIAQNPTDGLIDYYLRENR